ncbi:hypothetical protein GBAR_LOCUS8007 [Geodia barretti]|uniref:Uncharacterized protein n=1 Tax=Geodia barretti TaxID=519541 RepID=A0AA35RKY2_GEOBA|nr:hypothetical protein GBAR_LOCUS8007 [Geodia barretti]
MPKTCWQLLNPCCGDSLRIARNWTN